MINVIVIFYIKKIVMIIQKNVIQNARPINMTVMAIKNVIIKKTNLRVILV